MCNSDYAVKGGKSVTTGTVRLSNKQRGSIFASNRIYSPMPVA